MLEIVGRFVFNMFAGTFLFAIVAGLAVLIGMATQWLEKVGVQYYISFIIEGIAILLSPWIRYASLFSLLLTRFDCCGSYGRMLGNRRVA